MLDLVQAPIGTIASYGVVGSIAILSGVFNWVLFNKLNKEKDDRLKDWKEVATVLKEHDIVIAAFSSSNDARTRAIEASARSQELATAAQGSTLAGFQSMGSVVGDLVKEVQRLREALVQRGLQP